VACKITVVHCKRDSYDILMDRSTIYGNPWSHQEGTKAQFETRNREESINNYREWLMGLRFTNVLQKERIKILERLSQIRKQMEDRDEIRIACWCKPKDCHCDVIKEILES
jgi:hypothetical protein